MIRERSQDDEQEDYAKLGAHEFKVREMEQQVSVPTYPSLSVLSAKLKTALSSRTAYGCARAAYRAVPT
jgi:hypothetical protein